MRSRAFFYGLISVAILVFFIFYRNESLVSTFSAFVILAWFVQVPGTLILLLIRAKHRDVLQLILFGNVIGLALVPLLYYGLFFFSLSDFFSWTISSINVLLLVLVLKKSNWSFERKINVSEVIGLLMIVMAIC